MPAHISEPLILQPPPDLPTRFPHAVNLARQLALKYVHHYAVTEADLQTVGAVLWQTLDAAAVLEAARQAAGTRLLPLIVASTDPLAQSLPWECLYHPQHGFLGQQPGFTLSRRLTAEQAPPVPLSTGPLKVLLFTSMPDDLDPEKERLDVESEQAAVLEALDPLIQDGLVELTTPDDGRFAHLQALLREETFHLVFLSGHGEFREIPFQPPEAVFIFEGEDGHATPVTGADLAKAFMGSAVQAVVLSACQSGKSSSADLSASLAGQLLHAGLPHVIGMRESILDVAGTRFSQALCAALGRRERLDVALQEARQVIAQPLELSGPHRDAVKEGLAELTWGQWCLPLLYSRDPGRSLIDWNFQPVPPQPPLLRYEQLAGIPLPQTFIGRRRALRELGRQLQSGARQWLITGAGGQGKTSLAGHIAQRLENEGYLVRAYTAREARPWSDFITDLLMELDEKLREQVDRQLGRLRPLQQAQLIVQALLRQTQNRVALLLDNLETVQDPASGRLVNEDGLDHCSGHGSGQGPRKSGWKFIKSMIFKVFPLLKGLYRDAEGNPPAETMIMANENIATWLEACRPASGPSPLLLLTSRWAIPGWESAGRGHYPLTRPGYGDFLRYHQHLAGFRWQPERLRRLYRTLDGNFKGMELFHGLSRMAADEEAFLRQLEQAQTELRVYMAVETLVSYLQPPEQDLLNRLRAYHAPVIADGVRVIARNLENVEALLRRLTGLSLVDVDWDVDLRMNRFRLSSVVADWLAERWNEPALEIRQQAARYQHWVFEHLQHNLEQALVTHEALRRAGLDDEAARLALDVIVPTFDRRGLYHTLLKKWLPVLRESQNQAIRGPAFNWSGTVSLHVSDYENAMTYLQQSLAICRAIGDRAGEGSTLSNIAGIYQAQGDYAMALDYLQQALVIFRTLGNRAGEGPTLNNIGWIYRLQGDYAKALNYLKQSLTISRNIGDRQQEGITLNNIGEIYRAQENYATALDYLQQSLTISRNIGHRLTEGQSLNNISQIYHDQGDYATALDYLHQSLAIYRTLGDRAGEGNTLNNISQIYHDQGDYATALDYLHQSLAICRALGDRAVLCATLFNIGNIHNINKERQQALASWVEAYRIAREIGLAEGLNALDNLAKQQGRPGLEYWEMLARQLPAGEE